MKKDSHLLLYLKAILCCKRYKIKQSKRSSLKSLRDLHLHLLPTDEVCLFSVVFGCGDQFGGDKAPMDQGQNEREVEIPGSCSYCRWHNTGAVNDNCKVGSLQTFPRKFVIGKRGAFDAIKNIMKYCEQQLK